MNAKSKSMNLNISMVEIWPKILNSNLKGSLEHCRMYFTLYVMNTYVPNARTTTFIQETRYMQKYTETLEI